MVFEKLRPSLLRWLTVIRRVRELEAQLASLDVRNASPIVPPSRSGHKHGHGGVVRRAEQQRSALAEALRQAFEYLSSLCGWVVDACASVTARVARTIVV